MHRILHYPILIFSANSSQSNLLISPRKANGRAILSLRRNIKRHIRSQLCLLTRKLARTTRIALRSLNLNPQNVSLQLQDLILYFAILESSAGSSAGSSRSGNGIIETPSARLSVFGDLGGGGDDSEVRGGDAGEIVLVDLGEG